MPLPIVSGAPHQLRNSGLEDGNGQQESRERGVLDFPGVPYCMLLEGRAPQPLRGKGECRDEPCASWFLGINRNVRQVQLS